MSLKDDLDAASTGRDDGGMIHAGWVHFIQCGLDDLSLKAAIYAVAEAVPDVIPPDFPEVYTAEEWEPTAVMVDWLTRLNADLIMPIYGRDVAAIILKAREYLALPETTEGA